MAVVHIPLEFYYTEYIVKVQAINDMGPGPISHEVVIFSAEDKPQVAPQLVYALSYNSTSLNVSWSPVQETREIIRGKLIGHRVRVFFYYYFFTSLIFGLHNHINLKIYRMPEAFRLGTRK